MRTALGGIELRLPATSANLGPAFDCAGVALALYLTVQAELAEGGSGAQIIASGRDAGRISRSPDNLIVRTCNQVLEGAGRSSVALTLRLHNEIPLGVGCGSSAAALLAGVLLANHFGALGWTLEACIEEASRREGHPDNVAACALGALTVSAQSEGHIATATCGEDLTWPLLLALPPATLATEKSRTLLPPGYSRTDCVYNLQRSALLVAAFSQGRDDLLALAMQDRIHQPYRAAACPLLPRLTPLAGRDGILGVALSGAGPGVLLVVGAEEDLPKAVRAVIASAEEPKLELLTTRISGGVERKSFR